MKHLFKHVISPLNRNFIYEFLIFCDLYIEMCVVLCRLDVICIFLVLKPVWKTVYYMWQTFPSTAMPKPLIRDARSPISSPSSSSCSWSWSWSWLCSCPWSWWWSPFPSVPEIRGSIQFIIQNCITSSHILRTHLDFLCTKGFKILFLMSPGFLIPD